MACAVGYPAAAFGTGSYTPTGSIGTNVTTLVPRMARWVRMQHLVLIFGELDVQPTLEVGTPSRFRLSLPVLSGFNDADDVKGDFFSSSAGASGAIFANPGVVGAMQFAMKAKHSDMQRYTFQVLYRVASVRDAIPTLPSPELTPERLAAILARFNP